MRQLLQSLHLQDWLCIPVNFKVDFTPVNGETIDLQRFGELGKKGVLALMGDSTNIMKPGFTMSERTVGKTFDNIFAENEKHRIIVATFASNVDRVQQIINSAEKYGRKVVVEGRSMVNVMTTATELGYLDVPKNILIEMEQMKNYPPEKLVLITTGSQGEAMAALSKEWQRIFIVRFRSNRGIPLSSVRVRFREMKNLYQRSSMNFLKKVQK